MHKILDETTDPIKVINRHTHTIPFVISIPHSGEYLTNNMNEILKDNVILANTDWYLPELYSFLEELGFTIIINNVSRYVIDPNRDINNINDEKYYKSLIYTKTTFNKEMYDENISENEISDRINNFYISYHNELNKAINEKLKHFKKVYLIDLHSFGKELGKDIVLGNNNGATLNEQLFKYIQRLFIDNGFNISINDPYVGGFITKKYGNIFNNCESLQIEISYRSYIDNRSFGEEELPKINYHIMNDCKEKLKSIFKEISKIDKK